MIAGSVLVRPGWRWRWCMRRLRMFSRNIILRGQRRFFSQSCLFSTADDAVRVNTIADDSAQQTTLFVSLHTGLTTAPCLFMEYLLVLVFCSIWEQKSSYFVPVVSCSHWWQRHHNDFLYLPPCPPVHQYNCRKFQIICFYYLVSMRFKFQSKFWQLLSRTRPYFGTVLSMVGKMNISV